MKQYVDSDGKLRCRPDDNFQALISPFQPMKGHENWHLMDSWGKRLAVKLIAIGYNVDLEAMLDEAREWPDGAWGKDQVIAMIAAYDTATQLADSSIVIGALCDPDTPVRWLEWAERKGYSVEHLRKYLNSPHGLDARPAHDGEELVEPAEPSWQEKARSIADELHERDSRLGTHDSTRNIGERVAEHLRNAGINGPRGPVSGPTVVREALQGGKWKRKRLQK